MIRTTRTAEVAAESRKFERYLDSLLAALRHERAKATDEAVQERLATIERIVTPMRNNVSSAAQQLEDIAGGGG